MKRFFAGILASCVLFISSCVVEPLPYIPRDYTPPQPEFVVICKSTVDNGVYIWKKDCIILVREQKKENK